jgi:hypothetical protein
MRRGEDRSFMQAQRMRLVMLLLLWKNSESPG